MKLIFGIIKLTVDKINSIEFENGRKMQFQLIYSSHQYFLFFIHSCNDILFDLFDVSASLFSKQILGYYNGGGWPFCNTKTDCEKLLEELLNVGLQKGFGFTCDFHCDVSYFFLGRLNNIGRIV